MHSERGFDSMQDIRSGRPGKIAGWKVPRWFPCFALPAPSSRLRCFPRGSHWSSFLYVYICTCVHICGYLCGMHIHMISYFCLLLPSPSYLPVPVELDIRWILFKNQKCLSVLSLKPGEACSCSLVVSLLLG